MKRSLLTILFLGIIFSGFAGTTAKEVQVEPITINSIPEGANIISLATLEDFYFLDEIKELYLVHPYVENASGIDSTHLTISDAKYSFAGLTPYKLSNFEKAKYAFGIKLKDAQGNQLNYSTVGVSKGKTQFLKSRPWIEKDTIVFGVLMAILALIFYLSSNSKTSGFFKYVPALLLCYFIPAILNSVGIISYEMSGLYTMAKNYLLPTSLILLCLNIDLKGVINLGPKALIMFFTATIGIVIGGPIAFYLVSLIEPSILGEVAGSDTWRGLSTISGSWIGGGANQTAMKEIAECGDKLFSMTIIVDTFVANIFMTVLLIGAGVTKKIDKWLKADSSGIDALQEKMENYQKSVTAIPQFKHLIIIGGVAFLALSICHLFAGWIGPKVDESITGTLDADPDHWLKYFSSLGSSFFWLVLTATVIGVALSFTRARKLEGYGASKFGSIFIYILVATIGMHMNIGDLIDNWSQGGYLLLVGLIWILIHAIILFGVAKLIKAPFFFAAVGSQANVGGAASAPVVAAAFNPSLAPVGVLLAVLGYAVGTFGAYLCMILLQMVAG